MPFLQAGRFGRRRAARGIRTTSSGAQTNQPPTARRSAWLYSGSARLSLELSLPRPASRCLGWVILPRIGSQAAVSPAILPALHRAGFGTLSVDLLEEVETYNSAAAFNTPLL